MDFEAYFGSKYQLPIQVTGEIMHPSSSEFLIQDGIFPNTVVSSHLDTSFGNLSQAVAAGRLNPRFISNDMHPGVLTYNQYLAASIEKNTLMADFHSATPLQDGFYLNWSNYNMDSYLNVPSCPVTMSDPRVTNSLGVDQMLVSQQLLDAVQGQAQQCKRQQKQLSVLSPMSQSILQANQAVIPSLMKFDDSAHVQKKPRLDSKKDDVFLRYMIHELLLSESSKKLQSHDSKLVASVRQFQALNAIQRETIQFPPKSVEVHCEQLVTQQPMTGHQKQVPEPQVSPVSMTSGGNCADQLKQYLDNQRHRPKQNSITYWRKFVAEFFDSDAKKRWCLSKYDHAGCHAHFAFSRGAVDSWNCDLCGTKSGQGFEAKLDVLPRLFKVNFDNGLVEELLYLDIPCERKQPSGCTMLQYTKAVQERVYKHSRIVQEGQLCVTFTKELKIISWEFCAQHHEEFVLRRSIAPQVRQLLQASQKCQDIVDRNKSDGNLRHSLQVTHNRMVKSGEQIAKTLDLHAVNDLGLPKQLARFLQVAEVIDCMKDLITYSHENNLSPIESLNRFKRKQMNVQALQQDAQGFSSTRNNLMRMGTVATQYLGTGSVVINSGTGAEAEEPWNSSAETNYYRRRVMGTTGSKGITSNSRSDPSQETNIGVHQASTDFTERSTWNSYQNLLYGNSITSYANMMVKSGPPHLLSHSPSWHEAVPSSTLKSTLQPSSSSGSPGEQDQRNYLVNKLVMQKMFSDGEPQETLLPASPLTVQAIGGINGRKATLSRAGGNSQTKTASRKGSMTKVLEDLGVPILPGVQVKEEVFYG